MMLVVGMATALAGPARASVVGSATIASDLLDYPPGATVTLTGQGWAAGESVHIVVNDTIGQTWQHVVDKTAQGDGTVTDVFSLPNYFVSDYDVTATGPISGTATSTFTDAAAASLDQCANDAAPSPNSDGCSVSASDWVSGNVGSSKANYAEGDFLPYRVVMTGLTTGAHSITIEWDTSKAGKHALDYIGTFNQTVATANPCLGVAGCSSPTTFPIPADPQVTGAGVTPLPGNFTLYGGTITSVTAPTSVGSTSCSTLTLGSYCYSSGTGFAGDKSAAITINFSASVANPVLAWAGHIASRQNWGVGNGAVNIPGSPFHSRLIDLDGTGGNQDRSLSNDAVTFPGSITIIKQATPEGSTSFPFTASPLPLSNFNLVDDGTSANTMVFSNITNFQTYGVAESAPAGWALTGIVCSVTDPNGGSRTVTTPSVSINLKEGENVTCTYSNQGQTAHLIVIKHVVNNNGGTSVASAFTMTINGVTADGGNSFPGTESPGTDKTLSTVGSYTVTESGPSGYADTYSADCTGTVAFGQTKTCTINNDDIAPKLHLRKVIVNDNGGTKTLADFTLTADGAGTNDLSGTSPVDSGAGLKADTWTLSETSVSGYSASAWVCVGGTLSGANVTVAVGGEATCTITNDDQAAHLTLVKTVTNDNGGTAVAGDFTLSAAGPSSKSGPGGFSSNVDAGSYILSETNVPGYTAGSWSCVGGTQTGASVTLVLGDSAVCTINNDDIAPKLHLRKVIVNDNGGTKTLADFTLTADGAGTNDLSGTSPVDSGAGLKADTWTLSETSVSGYSASAWVCVGGTLSGANVTVAVGGEATCTITNDDIAPKLHLRKVVVNDNGGTRVAADFTLKADGTGANDLSGTSPVDSGPGLKADTWALSETSVYGYTASAWVCVGGTASGANVTVAIGGEATCTITNDDQPGKIVVIKNAKPAQGSFAFTTTGTGYTGFTLTGATTNDGNVNTQTLNAGSYTVREATQLGWILTGIGGSLDANTPYSCVVTGTGGSSGLGDLTTQTATISLKNGDTVTCTFENTGQGVTRTQGFWATHSPLANSAWFGGTAFGHTFPGVGGTAGIGDTLLCGRPIDTVGKLMGGFWSDIAKKSTGAKRSSLDQARMQLLQQLLAAEFNASAFGSVPAGGSGQFAVWEAAYCGTNQSAMQNALQGAASFNTSGDSASFTPGTSADSKNARTIANKVFWDTLL